MLDDYYGSGNWGEAEIREYLKLQKCLEGKVSGDQVEETDTGQVETMIESKLAKYKEQLANLTPNDEAVLRQMATIEVQLGMLDEKLNTDEFDPDGVQKITLSKQRLLAEFRQLQTSIGLDRRSREGEEDDAVAIVQKFVRDAKNFVETYAVKITCPYCGQEKVVINQGMIIFHFRDNVPWQWRSICPRCGKEFTIDGNLPFDGFQLKPSYSDIEA